MIFEIPKDAVLKVMIGQISSFFSITTDEVATINTLSDEVFGRCDRCFSKNENKYYSRNGETYFNPFHSGQYNVFLYYFSNTIFKKAKYQIRLADKVYYLNKMMNSCDLFYEIELPEYFMLDQPVGTVLGRAKYGNFFKFTQNCTVGNDKNIFPTIGENVQMAANSMIFGDSKIGDNTVIGVGAIIKNEDIPANSIVFGHSPNLIIKTNKQSKFKNLRGGLMLEN
jgi:serine O-acetyltransferase